MLYEDSYRNVAIAINGGSAAQMLGRAPGDRVRIRAATAERLAWRSRPALRAARDERASSRTRGSGAVLRGRCDAQFDALAPRWDAMRRPDALAPLEAALEPRSSARRRGCSTSAPGPATARVRVAAALPGRRGRRGRLSRRR